MANIANTANDSNILNSWSLREFRNAYGDMSIGKSKTKTASVDSETGEMIPAGTEFDSCCFTHPTTKARTFVGYSRNLGILNAHQIISDVENLRVVERKSLQDPSKTVFTLCRSGWEAVVF